MERKDILLTHADTTKPGLEIAPYFNPTIRKSDGYDLQTLDVFDTDRLRELAKKDPQIPEGRHMEIETVDHVSDACGLGAIFEEKGLAGHFGYILSSHNFEHLPNPIKFLQGVELALQPGGTLSMAIPDYRCCFDHFRFPTRLADWLEAYHENRIQPSAATLFDAFVNEVRSVIGKEEPFNGNLEVGGPPESVLKHDISEVYDDYLKRLEALGDYKDKHCSVLFPEIFELHIRDLNHLGLIGLEVLEIHPTLGIEFFVHLRKPVEPAPRQTADAYRQFRHALLTSINGQLGSAAYNEENEAEGPEPRRRPFDEAAEKVLGKAAVSAVRDWNARRLARRRGRKDRH